MNIIMEHRNIRSLLHLTGIQPIDIFIVVLSSSVTFTHQCKSKLEHCIHNIQKHNKLATGELS